MFYVLKMTNPSDPFDTGCPTQVKFVGPFESLDAASAWGFDPANNPHDNPCWQVVDLEDTTVPVVAP